MKVIFAIIVALFGATATAQAMQVWFHSTGTGSAYDKTLAHDLAYRDAVAKISNDCSANLAGPSEDKSTYAQDPVTGQWRVQVWVSGLCSNDNGSPD